VGSHGNRWIASRYFDGDTTPARNLVLLDAAMETAAFEWMAQRITMAAEPHSQGRGGRYPKAGKVLAAAGFPHRSSPPGGCG